MGVDDLVVTFCRNRFYDRCPWSEYKSIGPEATAAVVKAGWSCSELDHISKVIREGASTNEGWIGFDRRQETTGAAFPTVNLPTTGVFLNEPRRNLEGSIGFGALASCINSRLFTACTRVGLFRDVVPAVVVLLRETNNQVTCTTKRTL